MYKILLIISLIFANIVHAVSLDNAIQQLSQEVSGTVVTPATTEELETLFKNATLKSVPRIFVDRLPEDFAEKGSPELYAKVITALILRSNERILREKILLAALKRKFEKEDTWSEQENAFYNSLVEKYDVSIAKTKATQLEQLALKIDEITPGLALLQSVYTTNWGKTNMQAPYAQRGWNENQKYAPIKYDSLIKATESYVDEMNSEPSYWPWREYRRRAVHRRASENLPYLLAGKLMAYYLEDPDYTRTLQQIFTDNPFIKKLFNATFSDEKGGQR